MVGWLERPGERVHPITQPLNNPAVSLSLPPSPHPSSPPVHPLPPSLACPPHSRHQVIHSGDILHGQQHRVDHNALAIAPSLKVVRVGSVVPDVCFVCVSGPDGGGGGGGKRAQRRPKISQLQGSIGHATRGDTNKFYRHKQSALHSAGWIARRNACGQGPKQCSKLADKMCAATAFAAALGCSNAAAIGVDTASWRRRATATAVGLGIVWLRGVGDGVDSDRHAGKRVNGWVSGLAKCRRGTRVAAGGHRNSELSVGLSAGLHDGWG